MPETFDEAAYEAASKLNGNDHGGLHEVYEDLKWCYFNGDGRPYFDRTDTQEKVVDYLLIKLYSIARRHGKFFSGEIVSTVISKQHDYGHENIAQFGEIGLVVRLADKVARIQNLQGREAQNESLKDSYLDVCGYTVLFRMWRDGTFLLPLYQRDPEDRRAEALTAASYRSPQYVEQVDVGNVHSGW